MQRWGKTTVQTIRWYCPKCRKTTVRIRKDNLFRKRRRLFDKWLIGNSSLEEIAVSENITPRTLQNWFEPFWKVKSKPTVLFPTKDQALIIDAIYLHKRSHAVLIGKTKERVVFWLFAERENYFSWLLFFNSLPKYSAVVSDGQKGMLLALKNRWPDMVIQRCISHLIRFSLAKLTRKPKTSAGQELRQIVVLLSKVYTRRQKRKWLRKYHRWEKRYRTFLKEKTFGIYPVKGRRRWWYTHRNVRTVKTLVSKSLAQSF